MLKKITISLIALTFMVLSCSDDSTGPADGTAPTKISNLTVGSATDSSLTLSWTATGDDGTSGTANVYDIRYATDSFSVLGWISATKVLGEPTPQAAGTSESFTLSNLTAKTKYFFAVDVADETPNWAGPSNIASGFTETDSIAPATITDLNVIDSSTSSITLTWTAPGDNADSGQAAAYDMRYATFLITSGNWNTADTVVGETIPKSAGSIDTMEVNGLTDSTKYYFAIKTRDEHNNWSELSNVDSSMTESMEDIIDLSVIDSARGSITLTWTTPGDPADRPYAEYLLLYEITGSGSGFTDTASGLSAPKMADLPDTCVVTGLVYDTSYSFMIRSVDEADNWSDTSNFDTGLTRWSRFAYPDNYSTQYAPVSICVADFNDDTFLDFATANNESYTLSIYINNGDSTFTLGSTPDVQSEPVSIVTADFDNDTYSDLVVANYYSDVVTVLLNDGSGTFDITADYTGISTPSSVATADFNGDTFIDLAITGTYRDSLLILLNNGDGTFDDDSTAALYAAGDAPVAVVAGDLDGDNDIDIVVANMNSDNITVYFNDGDSAYFPTSVNYPVGDMPGALTLSDFDGDSDLDIVVTNVNSDNVSVLLNNGNGLFAAAVSTSVGAAPRSVVAANLNDDAYIDLAVANFNTDSISVLLGVGDGTFQSTINYYSGSGPRAIEAGDFDGDSYIDLFVANRRSNNVSVLWNRTINE